MLLLLLCDGFLSPLCSLITFNFIFTTTFFRLQSLEVLYIPEHSENCSAEQIINFNDKKIFQERKVFIRLSRTQIFGFSTEMT